MNKDQTREIIQLILAAKNFLNILKERFDKLKKQSQQIKMKDLKKRFETSSWSKEDENLLISTSYLSSCGIRISTIYEVMKMKPDSTALYGRNSLDKSHICHFLRDNVCHREPREEDKKKFQKRQEFIEELTIKQMYDYVRDAFKKCKSEIIESSGNYRLLESIVKNKLNSV